MLPRTSFIVLDDVSSLITTKACMHIYIYIFVVSGPYQVPVFPTSVRGLESLRIQIQPIHIQDHRYVILVPDISNGDGRQATSTFRNRPAEELGRFHDDVTSRSSTTPLRPPQDIQLPTLVCMRMPACTNQPERARRVQLAPLTTATLQVSLYRILYTSKYGKYVANHSPRDTQ